MNWLLVVVLVILAGHTIKGYRRGLLRVLFSHWNIDWFYKAMVKKRRTKI